MRLLVVDVSDRPRADPAYGAELRELSASIQAAAAAAGFDVVRRVADAGPLAGDAGLAADVIVLTGGEDVDPALYGGDADYPGREEAFTEADLAQVELVREAVGAGVPLIGICRGMQVLNVALGGDLVQHLHGGGHVRSGGMIAHPVTLEPDSRLAAALGATAFEVQSSHHQAVGRPGEGLRVVGRAPDGTVEAIEHRSAPAWGVQWHPEDAGSRGTVLADLLAAARGVASAAREASSV